MNHEQYMIRALELARQGIGKVSPNPRVGAVLVSTGTVIAEGYHAAFGSAHAEIETLRQAPLPKSPLTLYVNLEPCSHHGKTPPCTETIIKSGIRTVVYGMKDPNPKVSGRGIAQLQAAGIEVVGPVLENACIELNAGFIKSILTQKPWITLKIAQTIDGMIALNNGQSRWITCEESRNRVHECRSLHDAVLVGVGTILQDNPHLNVRLPDRADPMRIILDSKLRTPFDANVIMKNPEKTLIITSDNMESGKISQYRERGTRVLKAPLIQDKLQISAIGTELIESGICSIFVEGGGQIFSSFLHAGLADQMLIFIAPKIFGQGIPAFSGFELSRPDEAFSFVNHHWTQSGVDILLEGTITCLQDLLKK